MEQMAIGHAPNRSNLTNRSARTDTQFVRRRAKSVHNMPIIKKHNL